MNYHLVLSMEMDICSFRAKEEAPAKSHPRHEIPGGLGHDRISAISSPFELSVSLPLFRVVGR